jgi:mannose-1-phosphate guanylyltransferase
MVLCAGLGTRLRPLSDLVPKPAVPVCGVPLVRWALGLVARAGARRAVVNAHHLAGEMAAAAREAAAALGLAVEVSHERSIAGTGGALREARALLAPAARDDVVVVNGDILFDVDVAAARAAHRASGALATMVLMEMPPGARYAAVEADAGGAVRRIAGTFGPGGEGLRPYHFSGVHVVSPALLARLPAAPHELDVREVYAALMRDGHVRAHVVAGYWNDLGTPARYLEANLDVLAGRVPLGHFGVALPPAAGGAIVAPGASVAPGAVVGPGAFVGAGAVVGAGAIVREAVVWPGTAIAPGERVERAIAAGALRVPVGDAPGAGAP